MKLDYIILVISIAWIVIDAIIADQLFEYNHTLAKWLQGGLKDTSAARFAIFNAITQFGYTQVVGIFISIGFFFFANKIQALKVLLYTLFSSYLLSLLKLIYHEPRPYFVYSDLQGIGCDTEFGKPSGHAMVTLILYFLIFDSFINKKFFDYSNSINFLSGRRESGNIELVEVVIVEKNNENDDDIILNDQVKVDNFLNNKIIFSLYVIWIFLIGFSRIILGAHSFGQVLLGWSYGTICIILYRLKLDKIMENTLLTIIHKGFVSQNHFRQYIMSFFVGYIILVGLNLLAYNFVNDNLSQVDKDKYARNIMNKPYCTAFKQDNYKFLADKCMMDSVTISVVFAIFVTIAYTKGTYHPERWVHNYLQLPHLHKLYRLLVMGIVCLIPALFTYFLHLPNIYLHYFFKGSLQAFLVSFFLIKVVPKAFSLLKLDIEGDFLQTQQDQSFFDSNFSDKDFAYPYQK